MTSAVKSTYRVCASNSHMKTKEPLKFLSSSGVRGTKFISVDNFPAQWRPSFGKQPIFNFGVMAVRGIKLTSR